VGVALFSIGGGFLRANPTLCRLLGYSEEELLQKTHLDVVHLEDLEATAVARAQVISGKTKPRLAERRYLHTDSSTIWAHASGTVARMPPGRHCARCCWRTMSPALSAPCVLPNAAFAG
jgi:PAS domain S-box-containing protein